MHLVQIFLPLYDNAGNRLPPHLFTATRDEMMDRFGGMTSYNRVPASGLWQDEGKTVHDDLVIYEVMTEPLDMAWWRHYRGQLEHRFSQDTILIRVQWIELV
ncbi:hypothetical protein ACFQUU_00535 [Herbaspirillum sp. GCM10030257]|uniref:hypothetical protein n=1 Tax=Herbaspirillum sp. GCM10030257 TaxID=3273393 RepID=UPI003610E201